MATPTPSDLHPTDASAAPQEVAAPPESSEAADRKPGPRRRLPALVLLLACAALMAVPVGWWIRIGRQLDLAQAAMRAANFRAAVEALAVADRLEPDRADVHYHWARAYRRWGKLDRFLAHLERARELGWPEADLERQRLLAATQMGDVNRRQDQLRKLLASQQPDAVAEEIYEAMAKGYLASLQLQDADNCIQFWLSWDPDAPQALLWRGEVLDRLGRKQEAERHYRRVLEVAPDNPQAMAKLAVLLLADNRVEDARALFVRAQPLVAREESEFRVEVLVGLADCARRLNDLDQAREAAEQALNLNPPPLQQATAHHLLGQVALTRGQQAAALRHLEQAVALSPHSSKLHHALGNALALAGDKSGAQQEFAEERRVKALEDQLLGLVESLSDFPTDPERRVQIGQIMLQQGLVDQAEVWFRTALQFDPANVNAHRALAVMYQQQGKLQQASQHMGALNALQQPAAP